MKAKNIVIAILLGGCAVGAALWLGNSGHWLAEAQTEPDVASPENDPFLEMVGPPAKAEPDELVYDFGVMERGSKGEHVFTLRNAGKGVLRLVKGKATCTCTKFEINDDDELKRVELQPGESIKVTVAWKVKDTTTEDQFKTVAPIHTNDPDNKYVPFGVIGKIVRTMFIYPSRTILAPDIVGDKPTKASVTVGSMLLDDMDLVSAETDSKFMEVESHKLEFKDGRAEGVEGKCGYRFDVLIKPDIPVGHFGAPLRIKLRGSDGKDYDEELSVTTTRTGPIKIVAPNFDAHTMTLNLKDFDIAVGKIAELTMFVTVPDASAKYQFNVTESTNENVHLTIERDEKFKADRLQRYIVKFEIPPGAVKTKENQGRAEFVVETDHPDIKSIRFRTKYQAY